MRPSAWRRCFHVRLELLCRCAADMRSHVHQYVLSLCDREYFEDVHSARLLLYLCVHVFIRGLLVLSVITSTHVRRAQLRPFASRAHAPRKIVRVAPAAYKPVETMQKMLRPFSYAQLIHDHTALEFDCCCQYAQACHAGL
jgi:hypothetical protein